MIYTKEVNENQEKIWLEIRSDSQLAGLINRLVERPTIRTSEVSEIFKQESRSGHKVNVTPTRASFILDVFSEAITGVKAEKIDRRRGIAIVRDVVKSISALPKSRAVLPGVPDWMPISIRRLMTGEATFPPNPMSDKYQSTFSISVVGEITGDRYAGLFKVKTRLSHRDRLMADQRRRDLIGPVTPESAGVRALSTAEICSQLAVRVLEFPTWWENDGLDLTDDAPLANVYEAALKAEADETEKVTKKGEAAKAELKADSDESK